jgi:probable addiction module antidote protein
VPRKAHLLADLSDPSFAAAYLNAAAREPEPALFLRALRNVIEANGGVAKVAESTDLNRQAVYRMLSKEGNPELKSLQRLLGAAGLGLMVQVAEQNVAGYKARKRIRAGRRRSAAPRSGI